MARRLLERLRAWREKVGAQMPTPNPNYDPTKPQHIPDRPAQPAKKGAG